MKSGLVRGASADEPRCGRLVLGRSVLVMALHLTTTPRRRRVAAPVALGLAATLIVLAGCDNLSFRRLDYDNTEAVRITTIRVSGGSGDVVVRGTGPASEVRIKRVVRYQGGRTGQRPYEIKGSELVLDTDCGSRCSISYEVTVPEGVAVQGETSSGDVELSRVGTGGATGELGRRADLRCVGRGRGGGPLRQHRGERGRRRRYGCAPRPATSPHAGWAALSTPRPARAMSHVELDKPASARVHASSGDVTLVVPAGQLPGPVQRRLRRRDRHRHRQPGGVRWCSTVRPTAATSRSASVDLDAGLPAVRCAGTTARPTGRSAGPSAPAGRGRPDRRRRHRPTVASAGRAGPPGISSGRRRAATSSTQPTSQGHQPDQREDQQHPDRQAHRVLVGPAHHVDQRSERHHERHVPEVDGERPPVEHGHHPVDQSAPAQPGDPGRRPTEQRPG